MRARARGDAARSADLARRTLELFRAKPHYIKGMKLPEPRESSLFSGETGILLAVWRLAPSDELADDLHERVHASVDNEAEEVMWGTPGTLIAAQAMPASRSLQRTASSAVGIPSSSLP